LTVALEAAITTYPHTFAAWASGGTWKPWAVWRRVGQIIGDALWTARTTGVGAKICVNMQPGVGKSQFISRWTPTWALEKFPDWRIVVGAHGAELAAGWGRQIRNEFATNPKLRTRLSQDSKAADRWDTEQGGGVKTCGVGSGITGIRGNLMLLDDPYPTWEAANSATYRRKLVEWFGAVFKTRMEPDASMVVLHHRMHSEDLTAHIMEQYDASEWVHIVLPAIAGEDDWMGRAKGEPLIPERWTIPAMEAVRENSGEAVWCSMYQQNPILIGAGAAYHRFSAENIAPVELNPSRPLIATFDFNRNPHMHLLLGQYDEQQDTFIWTHELTESKNLNATLVELEGWLRTNKWDQPVWVMGDASGTGKSIQTGDSDYELITAKMHAIKQGHRTRILKSNPPIVERIAALNDALHDINGKARTKVNPRCKCLLWDFVKGLVDDDGKPDDANVRTGHSAAACGYAVHFLRPVGGWISKRGK